MFSTTRRFISKVYSLLGHGQSIWLYRCTKCTLSNSFERKKSQAHVSHINNIKMKIKTYLNSLNMEKYPVLPPPEFAYLLIFIWSAQRLFHNLKAYQSCPSISLGESCLNTNHLYAIFFNIQVPPLCLPYIDRICCIHIQIFRMTPSQTIH